MAATSRLWVAVVTSVAAMLAFNFFFLPPVGAFTIADPQNWIALIAFLAVSLVASNLSAVARARTQEAVERRDELARLFDLSRDVLLITESREAIATLARSVARRFDLESVAVALPRAERLGSFRSRCVDRRTLTGANCRPPLPPRKRRSSSTPTRGHIRVTARLPVEGRTIRLVPLRVGTKPIGLLAASGRPIEAGTLDALAGLVAIAIERAQFLEERKTAELTRQSEELKTALLASLGHDLRTPLTAIRVAASNLQSLLARVRRIGTSKRYLILAEVERLTRLFENFSRWRGSMPAMLPRSLVGRIPPRSSPRRAIRWSSILQHHDARGRRSIATCRSSSIPAHGGGAGTSARERRAILRLAGSTIDVHARVTDEGLSIAVRDHGPGIAPADVPHLFERFYRGVGGKNTNVRHRNGPLDRAGTARRRGRSRLGGESPGGWRNLHHACPGRGQGNRSPRASPT